MNVDWSHTLFRGTWISSDSWIGRYIRMRLLQYTNHGPDGERSIESLVWARQLPWRCGRDRGWKLCLSSLRCCSDNCSFSREIKCWLFSSLVLSPFIWLNASFNSRNVASFTDYKRCIFSTSPRTCTFSSDVSLPFTTRRSSCSLIISTFPLSRFFISRRFVWYLEVRSLYLTHPSVHQEE